MNGTLFSTLKGVEQTLDFHLSSFGWFDQKMYLPVHEAPAVVHVYTMENPHSPSGPTPPVMISKRSVTLTYILK